MSILIIATPLLSTLLFVAIVFDFLPLGHTRQCLEHKIALLHPSHLVVLLRRLALGRTFVRPPSASVHVEPDAADVESSRQRKHKLSQTKNTDHRSPIADHRPTDSSVFEEAKKKNQQKYFVHPISLASM